MTQRRFFLSTSEIERGSKIHIRAAEEAEIGRCDDTAVENSSTSPYNYRNRKKKKVMVQVKIRRK